MQKKFHFLIFMFIFSLSSCVSDMDMNKLNKDIEHEMSLTLPIGHTKSSIFDVFAQIDNDGTNPHWLSDSAENFVYLYLDTLLLLPVEQEKIFKYWNRPVDVNSVDGGTGRITQHSPVTGNTNSTISYTEYFDFGFNEPGVQRLDKVHIIKGKIKVIVRLENITVSGTGTKKVDVKFKFPNIPNTNPSGYTTTIDASLKTESDPVFIDLSDALIEFNNNCETPMDVDITFTTTTSGKFEFNANSDIKIDVQMVGNTTDIVIDKAWGFFNRSEILTNDRIYTNIPTDLFGMKEVFKNHLHFHDPRIIFDVTNNIGVPLHFIVDSIRAVDTDGEARQAKFLNDSKSTKVPLAFPVDICQNAFSSVEFNRENGHTEQLFYKFNPTKFDYSFHVKVDSIQAMQDLKPETYRQHFICTPLYVDMHVKSFLKFWFDEETVYHSLDTIKFDKDLKDLLNIGGVQIEPERVSIYIDFKNRLPVRAGAVVIFVDENDNEVYRQENISIESPDVDAMGKTISVKECSVEIRLIEKDTEQVLKTRKIIFDYESTAKIPESQKIYVQGNDYLEAFVSLFVKGKVSTNLDSIFKK